MCPPAAATSPVSSVNLNRTREIRTSSITSVFRLYVADALRCLTPPSAAGPHGVTPVGARGKPSPAGLFLHPVRVIPVRAGMPGGGRSSVPSRGAIPARGAGKH